MGILKNKSKDKAGISTHKTTEVLPTLWHTELPPRQGCITQPLALHATHKADRVGKISKGSL